MLLVVHIYCRAEFNDVVSSVLNKWGTPSINNVVHCYAVFFFLKILFCICISRYFSHVSVNIYIYINDDNIIIY